MIFLGLAGAAQAQSLRALESREEGRRWEAVGRLEIAGTAFCTGALIAPELVLTAAHCLFDPATGSRVHVDDIQFLAGWRNGRAAGASGGASSRLRLFRPGGALLHKSRMVFIS